MAGEEEEEFPHQQERTQRLVPWLNWDEWNFVRESLFSSSPASVAASLRRISAWRARGRLPVAVEVTAAIFESQQKDPYFSVGTTHDTLNSEEMLAMSYCMGIMRLVNGFVDKTCRKEKLSISKSAEAMGIPRLLVDIRHEGSHRGLPSLPLLRSASLKALDWLKSYYWESQRNLIPNVRDEIKSRMKEMIIYLNSVKTQEVSMKKKDKIQQVDSPQSKKRRVTHSVLPFGHVRFFPHVATMLRHPKAGSSQFKGFRRQKTILRNLIRLYSLYPSEVVLVLLEFSLKTYGSFGDTEAVECSENSQGEVNTSESKALACTIDDWNAIVKKLANREPALLLTMLEEVLTMIELQEAKIYEMGEMHLVSLQKTRQIDHLTSLALWLLKNMMDVKTSSYKKCDNGSFSDSIPNGIFIKLLRRFLLLTPGNSNILQSASLLAKFMGNSTIVEKLNKLQLQKAHDLCQVSEDSVDVFEHVLLQQEESIKRAAKKLEYLKSRQLNTKTVDKDSSDGDTSEKTWCVAKSWSQCPIGMLPRALGLSGALPVLEQVYTQRHEFNKSSKNKLNSRRGPGNDDRAPSCDIESSENSSAIKKMRETIMDDIESAGCSDESVFTSVEGLLMIDGIWKKVEHEELFIFESGVRVLV